MARISKKKHVTKKDIICNLNPEDALTVINMLIKDDPGLEEQIYQIAVQILSKVSTEDIAYDVCNALDRIEVEELWARSGKTRYGYTDPSEESWVMFEEAIDPFIDEMKKYQKLSMSLLAKKYCIGIIKGIQEYEAESTSEFMEWAVDAPEAFVENVFDEWKNGEPEADEIAEVRKLIDANLHL